MRQEDSKQGGREGNGFSDSTGGGDKERRRNHTGPLGFLHECHFQEE